MVQPASRSLKTRPMQAALYYARKRNRTARLEANPPPAPLGSVKLGSTRLYQGNELIVTGGEDVQLADALAALTGDVVIGGDSIQFDGSVSSLDVLGISTFHNAINVNGFANLTDALAVAGVVQLPGLGTADPANTFSQLWRDNAAGRAVKVGT